MITDQKNENLKIIAENQQIFTQVHLWIFSFYLYNFLSSSPWDKLYRWDALLTCITTGQCTLLSFLVYGDSVQHLVTIFFTDTLFMLLLLNLMCKGDFNLNKICHKNTHLVLDKDTFLKWTAFAFSYVKKKHFTGHCSTVKNKNYL